MAKINTLRKAWIDKSLMDEIDKLALRMNAELGEGKKTTASRLLANSIKKSNLVAEMEFVSLPKKKKKVLLLENDRWGWKI